MSAAGRFCIGCNARFEGKRCRLYHPEYMYDYQEKPPEELSDGGAPGSGDDANAIAAAILAEAAAEMEGGATSGHGWSASPVAARAPSAEPTTTLAAAAAPLTSVAQLKKDGTVAFRNEDYATAAERYAAAAALEPTERSHPSNASLALLRMGRHADALASAERCCELAPDWHKGYYRRGCAQQALGQNAAARSSFMKAQQCDPNDKTVRDALVELGPAPEPAPQPEPAEEPERQAESEPAPEPELRPESDPDPEEHLDRNGSATAETGLDELEGPAATPYNGFFAGVISTRNRGRCVVARRDLAVGEVAWQFKPWAAVSSDEFLAATCAFCFRDACATSSSSGTDGPAVYTVRCEQCEIYHYCSEECKRAASPLHSLECRPALQVKRMTSSGGIRRDSTATRLLIRILARRRLEIQRSNSSRMFEPDEPVEIQGLSGAPQHNGKLGTVLRFDQKRGRYLVRLEEGSKGSGEGDCTNAQGDGKPLGLKPANLLRRKLSQQTTGPIWCDATFSHIQKLQSHVTELPPARIESMRTVVKGLLSIPGLNGGGEASEALTEDGMLQLLGAVQCNSQGIVDLEHHQRLGTHAIKRGELLSAPYDINHSCDPNTWVSITGDCVQFRVIRPIAPGEELTFTYTDLYLPRIDRREKLLSSHCFACDCNRCTDDSVSSLDARVTGFRCDRPSCESTDAVVSFDSGICSSCAKPHSRGRSHLRQVYVQAAERLQRGEAAYRQGSLDSARDILESLLQDVGNVLYRSHILVYSSLHHLTSLCVQLDDAWAAGNYCRRAISCLQEVFPKYHTETAMMHRELAYIEWRLASGSEHKMANAAPTRQQPRPGALRSRAVAEFDKAMQIIEVCYGPHREVYQKLLDAKSACAAGENAPEPTPPGT